MKNVKLEDIVFCYDKEKNKFRVGVLNSDGTKVYLFDEKKVVSSEEFRKPYVNIVNHLTRMFEGNIDVVIKFWIPGKEGHEFEFSNQFSKRLKTNGVSVSDALKLQAVMNKCAASYINHERREQAMEDNRDSFFKD